MRATPDDGNGLQLWTTRACVTEGSGGCEIDCGPDSENTECQLRFDASAGDVDFDLAVGFEAGSRDIRPGVTGSGQGAGTVMTLLDGLDLDCQIEQGEESGICEIVLVDVLFAGCFEVAALAEVDSEFSGWDEQSCYAQTLGTCSIDCGAGLDEGFCQLSYAGNSGAVSFDMKARFEPLP